MPDFLDLRLQTPRLTLRPLLVADADAVFAQRSDPQAQRYGSHLPWTDRQLAIDWIERNARAMANDECVQLAIARREDDAVIGTCALFSIDTQSRHAELGYGLARTEWGRGYANEAVTALLDWGFEHLSLLRVEADVDPRNAASVRALERLGFVREGHLRERWVVGDEICDSWIYGLLAREWRASRAGVHATA